MFKNIDCFRNSNMYKIKQCTVCLEAWPLKSSLRSQKDSEYQYFNNSMGILLKQCTLY